MLAPLREAILRDRDLLLEIREGYVNVYYKGNSLLKLARQGTHYSVRVGESFFVPAIAGLTRLNSHADAETFVDAMPAIKERILASHRLGNEIEYEQILIRANNSEARNNTEYFVVDRQVVLPGGQGRMDLTAIHWPKEGRRRHQVVPLVLLEVKFGLNSDIPYLHEQLARYYESFPDSMEDLAEEAQRLLRQKIELGLFSQPEHRLSALQTLVISPRKQDMRFGVVFIDYDPASKRLNIEALRALSFWDRIDIFHVGFGLWRSRRWEE